MDKILLQFDWFRSTTHFTLKIFFWTTSILYFILYVCRRQILTTKVDPRTVRVKIFLMAVDPYHRYSNESERANWDVYDGFKMKKPFGLHGCYKKNSAL